MLRYHQGDIFTKALNHQNSVIIHGCNCQGVMGSGIALQIKTKYPKAFTDYVAEHRKLMQQYDNDTSKLLGHVSISAQYGLEHTLTIVNAFTQDNFGKTNFKFVSYDAVDNIFRLINRSGVFENQPIFIPKIGAGLGGGNWEVIETIIKTNSDNLNITVCVL